MSIVAFCVAITAAVSRSRLDAVDTLLSWTIVYGLLLAAIIGVDVVLVAILGGLIDDRALLTAAVAIVFVAYAPARERLLGAVDRLVYGRRGDPFQVISSLSAGLESAETDEDQLEHAARSVAEAFASPYVAVSVDLADGARRTSSFGTPTGDPVVVPLVWLGEHVGELRMAPGRAH